MSLQYQFQWMRWIRDWIIWVALWLSQTLRSVIGRVDFDMFTVCVNFQGVFIPKSGLLLSPILSYGRKLRCLSIELASPSLFVKRMEFRRFFINVVFCVRFVVGGLINFGGPISDCSYIVWLIVIAVKCKYITLSQSKTTKQLVTSLFGHHSQTIN